MDFSGIFSNLAKWLSSGPVGIIAGIFGLGGIAFALYRVGLWIKEVKFGKGIDSAAASSGTVSGDLSNAMKNDTATMDEAVAAERERLIKASVPVISIEGPVKVGIPFKVVVTNLDEATGPYRLFADRKYPLGNIRNGSAVVTLNDKGAGGTRNIGFMIGDVWYSKDIVVT